VVGDIKGSRVYLNKRKSADRETTASRPALKIFFQKLSPQAISKGPLPDRRCFSDLSDVTPHR